jgi:hypothetical protein
MSCGVCRDTELADFLQAKFGYQIVTGARLAHKAHDLLLNN